MAEITASMVKELREKTDAPMMECKKALTEASGDLAKAEEILRVRLGNKASKAAEPRGRRRRGCGTSSRPDGKLGAIIEVNCETDFVAKNEDFLAFARNLAEPGRRERIRPMWRRCRRCRSAARPWNRCAQRWSGRSARTCRSAASCACRPRAGSRATCTAAPRSACWSTWSAATRHWPRIWRCISPPASRWRCRRTRCRPS